MNIPPPGPPPGDQPQDNSGDTTGMLKLASDRERECQIGVRAYTRWLARLTPLRWITVSGGIILSALAAFVILLEPYFLGDNLRIISGTCAALASVLTGLHTGLDCDAHQSECRRLIQLYRSLETAFRSARSLPAADLSRRVNELDQRFQEAVLKAAAAPPTGLRARAEREVLGSFGRPTAA